MVINQARNESELRSLLKTPLKYAVEILMKKILEANEDAINKVVYYGEMGTPKYYKNTYEFLNAWDASVHTAIAGVGHDVEGQFFYAPDKMKTSAPPSVDNNNMGQHHGVNDEYGDSREYLADIIYQGLAGPAYGEGPWRRKRDAFSELLRIVGKHNFNKWLKEAMEEVGLTVVSHGGIVRKDEKE